jgi:REP element-mobilizing transposase RayT
MPRPPRLETPGTLYHVISRGNARQKIFLSKDDFQRYLLEINGDRFIF